MTALPLLPILFFIWLAVGRCADQLKRIADAMHGKVDKK